MSKWRVKGFVQDSDEEGDDLELSSTRDNSQTSIEICRGGADTITKIHNDEERLQAACGNIPSGEKNEQDKGGTWPSNRLSDRGQNACFTPVAVTQTQQDDLRCLVAPSSISDEADLQTRERTESPDPLLDSPTPRAERIGSPFESSQILGVSNISHETRTNNNHSEFGTNKLALLLDLSDDSELSDPPSDLDELYPQYIRRASLDHRNNGQLGLTNPASAQDGSHAPETVFASPRRRTTVQVVIPRPTNREQRPQLFDQYVERSFRTRKPIQLHPYVLEGERYRRDLQGRGVRPVTRVVSPPHKSHHGDPESQEQDFDPSKDAAPSSPPEIPVSTPVVRRRTDRDRGSSSQRKLTRSQPRCTIQSNANRKGSGQGRRNASTTLRESTTGCNPSVADIWTIPQSPPYSSSPPINRSGSRVRNTSGRSTITPVPDLLTPSNSSSVPAPLDLLSDDESVIRSLQRSGHRSHQPITLSSDSSSSDTDAPEDEAQGSDHDLRKVGKRIRGVLPASWLRLDLQAQERHEKQRRERLNALQSPAKSAPQRGVAQRVIRRQTTPSRPEGPIVDNDRTLELTDESEDDIDRPVQTTNLEEAAQEAFRMADMLDERYADDVSDTMENDRLHLFTLGGTGEKRKKQSKLTDVFSSSKKRKLAGQRSSHWKPSSSERHLVSRKVRRTPPPALSILDMDTSPSTEPKLPQFLRIARREARRRPDHARQMPTNKYIRLHTAQDTHEANATLQEWRRGAIKPRTIVAQTRRGAPSRRPLTDLDQNQQPLHWRGGSASQRERQTLLSTEEYQSAGQQMLPPRLVHRQEERTNTERDVHLDRRILPSSARHKQMRHKRPRPLPFRSAQLEGLDTDHGSSNRRAAFQRGLQRVDRQFDLQQPLLQPSQNPQLARFLASHDVTLPPSPTTENAQEQVQTCTNLDSPVPERRRIRKARAHRVDVETREYRQPSEPVVDEYLRSVSDLPMLVVEPGRTDQSLLVGLGPRGTQYPTTFDTSPLQDGTYFHVSTFVGSGALHRALSATISHARNLDEPAGYCNIIFLEESIKCGPWEDNVIARLIDSANAIWKINTSHDKNDVALTPFGSCFDKASSLIQSLVGYIATNLSFHDPIDRMSFINKTKQWTISMLESITSNSLTGARPDQPMKARPLALLLLLALQIYNIAHHPVVELLARSDLAKLITSIGKSLVGDILDHVTHLSDFLENNKRYKVRENGIRESDVIVESLVICMHALSQAGIPGTTFWELVGQSLLPAARRAVHLAEFETVWSTVFTLLPFVEINDLGIPMRGRRISFKEDNWTAVRALLQRTFALYPNTSKTHGTSVDEYIRSIMTRCYELVHFWHWNRCEPALYAMFDFFVAKRGLKHLQTEQRNVLGGFLGEIDGGSFHRIESTAKSFHIFLKCLYIGIQGMQSCYAEKKLRSVVLRLIPNHGRSHPKDQPMEIEALEALENHHDILGTLYRASPLPCRPSLELIKNLVHHENSHREACRIGIRSWANLTKYQLSSGEPYSSLQPLAKWHHEIMTQTLKQYRLAKTEAEEYLKSDVLNGSEATSLMVKQTMEKNQDQVIAALRDCIVGSLQAIGGRSSQSLLKDFLVDTGLIQLLELPHLQDRRLIVVIRDALGVFQTFARLPRLPPTESIVSEQDEESQDYGDSFEISDFLEMDHEASQPDDFLQNPLWHLLSNAFGAEASPDDIFLIDCIDTWCLIACSQVKSGARSWTYYLDPFSQVSWSQLRRTEQTQKFCPYFMAKILDCDAAAYDQHRLEFLNALLISLTDRESMLRFQDRLLGTIIRVAPNEPLLKNLPFCVEHDGSSLDISIDTVRTRRLALISAILANMRDVFHYTIHHNIGRLSEVKGTYAAMLKDLMNAMKANYQRLGSGTTVTGAYVEFVQKIIQLLQQYTADIHPVLDFFTNSVAFPLPAADPTYVVGRLCGYAAKLSQPGIPKQLSVFVQTVAQQAATGGHQSYLVHQLKSALCMEEMPPKDRDALRNTLVQGILPAYIEAAFSSIVGFVIAQPILQSLITIIEAMRFHVRVFDGLSVQSICECLFSILHAFIRSTEHLKDRGDMIRQPHILQALALMFRVTVPAAALLDYVSGRCSKSLTKPVVTDYIERLALFVGEIIHDSKPQTIPWYRGDASESHSKSTELLRFSSEGLQSGMKANWSTSGGCIYFGQGHAKREVLIDWDTVEGAREELITAIEDFLAIIPSQSDDARSEDALMRDECVDELDV